VDGSLCSLLLRGTAGLQGFVHVGTTRAVVSLEAGDRGVLLSTSSASIGPIARAEELENPWQFSPILPLPDWPFGFVTSFAFFSAAQGAIRYFGQIPDEKDEKVENALTFLPCWLPRNASTT
jgi:hypothetical protein